MPHATALSLDVLSLDADALLAADPFFATVCDERLDRARAAQDAEHGAVCVRCGVDHTDQEHALTPEQAEHIGCDAETDLVCFACYLEVRAELAETLPAPPVCSACDGSGNGRDPALPCGACGGSGSRDHGPSLH